MPKIVTFLEYNIPNSKNKYDITGTVKTNMTSLDVNIVQEYCTWYLDSKQLIHQIRNNRKLWCSGRTRITSVRQHYGLPISSDGNNLQTKLLFIMLIDLCLKIINTVLDCFLSGVVKTSVAKPLR